MNDHRWADVFRTLASMERFLDEAIRLFAEGGLDGPGREAFQRQMILMHTMEIGYTSFEAAIVRTMNLIGETPPTGSDWHAQLLARAAAPLAPLRPAILSPDLAAAAGKVKTFRDWATRGYDAGFVSADAGPAVAAASTLSALARAAFERFAAEFDR